MLYVGCAIWAYDGWANGFFPPGTAKDVRLRAYARRLTAVEINATFYALPALNTVRRWAEETPPVFRFSPKFPRAISHTAQLKAVSTQTDSFVGVMRALGPRLGPLMLQLPPSFGPPRLEALREYLAALPGDLEVAVEVRHADWFKKENGARLDAALAEANAARVVFDVRPAHRSSAPEAISAKERKPNVPLVAAATRPYVVVRYISSPVLAENEAYFAEWAPRVAGWLAEGRRVYFYVHCPQEELSPGIARDFYRRVAAQPGVNLPPLPWDEIEKPGPLTDLSQLPLF